MRHPIANRLAAAVIATVAAVAPVLGLGGATPAGADPIGDCSASAGVLVVVDFTHWGGPIDMGCAATPTTGSNAMQASGFITAGTEEEGPAFVCRIGLASEGASSFEPTASEDPCVNTPPASAYWSYWHADAGQNTWAYSQQGFMSYQPPPGSIDAWVFGATNAGDTTGQPTFTPDQVREAAQSGGSGSFTLAPAPPPTTAPPTTAPPAPPAPGATTAPTTGAPPARAGSQPARTVTGGSARAAATATTAGSVENGPGAEPRSSTSVPASTAGGPGVTTTTSLAGRAGQGSGGSGGGHAVRRASASRGSAGGFQIVASPAASRGTHHGSSGPPAAFIAGSAAIVLLGAAGGAVAWRRRRAA